MQRAVAIASLILAALPLASFQARAPVHQVPAQSVARAVDPCFASGICNSGWPPPRFQGPVTATVTFLSGEGVDFRCRELGAQLPANVKIGACAREAEQAAYMPNPCDAQFAGEEYARRQCHENAHLNGWPINHGD